MLLIQCYLNNDFANCNYTITHYTNINEQKMNKKTAFAHLCSLYSMKCFP